MHRSLTTVAQISLGVITPRGDIRNYRETVMGRPLLEWTSLSQKVALIWAMQSFRQS